VALKGFACVLLGCRTHVATLGIEHDGQGRVTAANVVAQVLQLILGTLSGKVGNLWFDAAGVVGGDVHNRFAELVNRAGFVGQLQRQAGRVWVQTHHQHGLVVRPGTVQFFYECHGNQESKRLYKKLSQTAPAKIRDSSTAALARSLARPIKGWCSRVIVSARASRAEFSSSTTSTKISVPSKTRISAGVCPSQNASGVRTTASASSWRKAASWRRAAARPCPE